MAIKDFREAGYLQEANRRFFHPLGLALEVVVDPDGGERLGGIWDYRDDPEGVGFGQVQPEMVERARRVDAEWQAKAAVRAALYGAVVQPVDPDPDVATVTFIQGGQIQARWLLSRGIPVLLDPWRSPITGSLLYAHRAVTWQPDDGTAHTILTNYGFVTFDLDGDPDD